VDAKRLSALLTDLDGDRARGHDVGGRLCETIVEVLEVSGAGIVLMTRGEYQSTLGGSNAVIGVLEELQFTLGEGPCLDAFRSAQPVLEPDLVNPAAVRWPAFSGPAIEAGVRAVFGFPVVAGSTSLGAIDLYVDRAGALQPEQLVDAVVLAEVVASTVLSLQQDAAPGTLAPQLDANLHHRAVVHQASGMLAVQLDIEVDDALARIRAHAYAVSQPVNDVARDIVQRRLVLD